MGCLTFIVRRIDGKLVLTAVRDGEDMTLDAIRKDGEGIRISASLICSVGEIDGYYLLDVDAIRIISEDNQFLIVLDEDPEQQHYFYIEDISGTANEITISSSQGGAIARNILMSTDKIRWTNAGSTQPTVTIPLEANGKIYLRCNSDSWKDIRITATGRHKVGGKITSLLYGDAKHDTLKNTTKVFSQLFYGNTTLVSAEDLELPNTTLPNSCYASMFQGCTALAAAPVLPSTVLSFSCYASMFNGCASLTTAPALPATTLAESCYSHMFDGCISLVNPSALPATDLAYMCYHSMFKGCTSLTTAPALPATTLQTLCYGAMFWGCISLTEAPVLPATTLAERCYETMFLSCTNLQKAPVLPAVNLVPGCYNAMFKNCSTMNYIEAMFVTEPGDGYTQGWVYGVARTGTFKKNPEATWDVMGVHGVPEGWTIPSENHYFYIEDVSGEANTLRFARYNSDSNLISLDYSFDGANWTTVEYTVGNPIEITIPALSKVYIRSNTTRWDGIRTTSTGSFNIGGNILSLVYGNDKEQQFGNGLSNVFKGLFQETSVVDASRVVMPQNVVSYCYSYMFCRCTLLVAAPTLPATDLTYKNYCYEYMFGGCVALSTAPALPATSLSGYCYSNMFASCTSLLTAPALPANTLASGCYYRMFFGCTALATAPTLSATTLAVSCYEGMFAGCVALETAPELPAETLVSNCYTRMFDGCSSLNYIEALFTTTPTTAYTDDWVKGVAEEGTFVMNHDATWDVRGDYGIPEGWLVPRENNYFYVEDISGEENVFSFARHNSDSNLASLEYSTDGVNWITEAFTGRIDMTIPALGKLYIRSNTTKWEGLTTLSTGNFNLGGNILSLVYGVDSATQFESNIWSVFESLFENSKVVDASELVLPNNVTLFCYKQMFAGCTLLTAAPVLPATELANGSCYQYMFRGCTSLTTAPALPATTISGACYRGMFSGCTSLLAAPALPANTLTGECYYQMFSGCTSLVSAPILPATTLVTSCYNYMFFGCTSLNHIKALFMTTPGLGYTNDWVKSVAVTGIFEKNSNATWDVRGPNGVPENWTITTE